MEEENKIKGGVIIMGSLFWEYEKNCVAKKETDGKARREWREENLNMLETKPVRVPIRYGRFSGEKNRKNTYTMVLSRKYLEKLGTALVVPFNKLFSLDEEVEQEKLYYQISKLAKVEGIRDTNEKMLAKCWSAITIWINPNSKYLNQITKYWINNIVGDTIHEYTGKSFKWSDGTLLDVNYQLDIPIVSDLDFLLCTYMLPKYEDTEDYKECSGREKNKKSGYPSAQRIGEAISSSNPPYVTYFAENRVNGIVTADDEEIFKFIPKTY